VKRTLYELVIPELRGQYTDQSLILSDSRLWPSAKALDQGTDRSGRENSNASECFRRKMIAYP
jgi:hypothetical protein